MINKKKICASALLLGSALIGNSAFAACAAPLPSHAQLQATLKTVQAMNNGGFGLNMWVTIVNRAGIVCDVAHSGANPGDQWPGSRVISAQKANTANAFSLPGLALSTANLYSATQPGGSLFGLQESNPVNAAAAYGGAFSKFGEADDPMIGRRIGGVNVFGGGLALYAPDGSLRGGIGVSGDSSCADHNIAWRVRWKLGLDKVPAGVSKANGDDNIVYDIASGDASDINNIPGLGKSASGWGHPQCTPAARVIAVGNKTTPGFPKAGSTPAPF